MQLPSIFDEQARLHLEKMHSSMAAALSQTTEQHALALSVGHGQALSNLEVGMIALVNEMVQASQGLFAHIDVAQNSAIALHDTITSLHETLNATDEMAVKQHEMQKEALDLQGQLRQVMLLTRDLAIGGSLASVFVPFLVNCESAGASHAEPLESADPLCRSAVCTIRRILRGHCPHSPVSSFQFQLRLSEDRTRRRPTLAFRRSQSLLFAGIAALFTSLTPV